MAQKNNMRKIWEFEILGFLREEFPYVGISMPNLQEKPVLWRAIYLIVQGVNEIAQYHNDLVDMRIDMTDDLNMDFKFFALRGDLNEDYFKIIHLVAAMDTDGLYSLVCKYNPPSKQPDHKKNLAYIDDLVESGQNEGKKDTIKETAISIYNENSSISGRFVFKSDPNNIYTDRISFGRI